MAVALVATFLQKKNSGHAMPQPVTGFTAPTVGNRLIAFIAEDGSGQDYDTVSDDEGHTWTQVAVGGFENDVFGNCFISDVLTSVPTQIDWDTSASDTQDQNGAWVMEVSGMATTTGTGDVIELVREASSDNTTSIAVNDTGTVTDDDSYAFAFIAIDANSGGNATPSVTDWDAETEEMSNNNVSTYAWSRVADSGLDPDVTLGTWTTSAECWALVFVVRPASSGAQDITPAAVTVTASPGTLALSIDVTPAAVTVTATPGTLALSVDIPLTGPTVTATPGAMTITTGVVDITPAAVTVTAAPGTLAMSVDIPLAGPTVTATPGTLAITTGVVDITPAAVTVTASPGSLALSVDIPLAGPTVTATPGTVALAVDIPLAGPTVTATPGAVTVVVAAGPQAVTPAAVTVTASPGTLAISVDVPLVGPTVTATPGAVALAVDIPLVGPTVTATPGAVTVALDSGAQAVTPAAVTVTATPGTLAISVDVPLTGPTVTATPGAVALAVDIPLTGPTVTATPSAAHVSGPPYYSNSSTAADSSTSATSLTITAPADIQDDDVLIALVNLANQQVAVTPPAGWSAITGQEADYDSGRANMWSKVASSESGNYDFTWTGGTRVAGFIAVVRGADTATPIAASPTASTGTGNPIDHPASGSFASNDHLTLAVWSSNGSERTTTAVPSGYLDIEQIDTGSAGSNALNACAGFSLLHQAAITSEDPGNTSLSVGSAWSAHTIVIPELIQAITPAAVTVTATPGTLAISVDVPLVGPTVTASPGTVAMAVDIPLVGPTVTVTPGTVTIMTGDQAMTPDSVTVTVTPGIVAITTAAAPDKGSWYGLISILRENAEYAIADERTPEHCPNDGTLLRENMVSGEVECPFDGWSPTFGGGVRRRRPPDENDRDHEHDHGHDVWPYAPR